MISQIKSLGSNLLINAVIVYVDFHFSDYATNQELTLTLHSLRSLRDSSSR